MFPLPSPSLECGIGYAVGLGTGWGSLFIPVSALQLLHSGTGWDGGTLGWGLHKATTAKTGSRTECGKARVYTRAPLNWVGPLPAPGHSSILTICSCHQLVAPPPGARLLSSEANNNPRLLYPPFRALSTPPRSERRLAVSTWVKL